MLADTLASAAETQNLSKLLIKPLSAVLPPLLAQHGEDNNKEPGIKFMAT